MCTEYNISCKNIFQWGKTAQFLQCTGNLGPGGGKGRGTDSIGVNQAGALMWSIYCCQRLKAFQSPGMLPLGLQSECADILANLRGDGRRRWLGGRYCEMPMQGRNYRRDLQESPEGLALVWERKRWGSENKQKLQRRLSWAWRAFAQISCIAVHAWDQLLFPRTQQSPEYRLESI